MTKGFRTMSKGFVHHSGAPYKLSGTRNTHKGTSGITAIIGTSAATSERLLMPWSGIGLSKR
jgi:hypothetical protein